MARRTRDLVIDRGLDLVHERGFNATGVQDIADAAGIPKGSFYNYFRSKEDFAVAVLNRYADAECEELDRRLIRAGGPPLERLRGMYRHWIDVSDSQGCSRGCLTGNLCQEMASASLPLRAALDGVFRRIEGSLAACLREAQVAGQLSPEADPEQLAGFLYFGLQGALLRAKARGSTAPLRDFQEIVFGSVLR